MKTKRYNRAEIDITSSHFSCTEVGKKVWLFAKLQPSRARKRINAA